MLNLNNSILEQLETSQASKYLPGQEEVSVLHIWLVFWFLFFFAILQCIELSSCN